MCVCDFVCVCVLCMYKLYVCVYTYVCVVVRAGMNISFLFTFQVKLVLYSKKLEFEVLSTNFLLHLDYRLYKYLIRQCFLH